MINRLKEFGRSSLVKDSAKLASSNILLYLLPFIVTPILSRLYGPEYFGEWGVFSSTYQIINVILFLCYDHAIVKASQEEYPSMCALSFIVSLIIICITSVVFYTGDYLGIKYFIDFPCKSNFFALLLFTSITVILQNIANRLEKYWIMSIASFILGLSQAICRIILGVYVLFSNGLIAGTTIAQFLNICFFLIFVGGLLNKDFFSKISIQRVKSVAVTYKKFPLYDAPATLLLFATLNLAIIILSLYHTREEIGCLSIIHQLLLLPISLIGGAMGRVYYKQITDESVANDKNAVAVISTKMIKMVLVISMLPTLFITLGGDQLINIFLGAKWNNAGYVAICLTIWSIPNILTQPLVPIFRKTDKQNYMLYFNILNFILGAGTLLITCAMGISMYTSLFLYAIGSAIANYFMFAFIIKLTNVKFSQCIKPIVALGHIACNTLIFVRFIFI